MARVSAGPLLAFAFLLLHVFTTDGRPNVDQNAHRILEFPGKNENRKISGGMDDVKNSKGEEMFSPDKLMMTKKFGSNTLHRRQIQQISLNKLEGQRVNQHEGFPLAKNDWSEGVFPYDDKPLTRMEWSEGVSPDEDQPLIRMEWSEGVSPDEDKPMIRTKWSKGVFLPNAKPLTRMEWSEGVSPDEEVPVVKVNKPLAKMEWSEGVFPADDVPQANKK